MKIHKEKFITKKQADALMSLDKRRRFWPLRGEHDKTVLSVVNKIVEAVDGELSEDSYFMLENSNKGTRWHVDTGTPAPHMKWCKFGASILLNDDFEGGDFWYRNSDQPWIKKKIERKKYSLIAHSSDQEHKVMESTGDRFAFLLFI